MSVQITVETPLTVTASAPSFSTSTQSLPTNAILTAGLWAFSGDATSGISRAQTLFRAEGDDRRYSVSITDLAVATAAGFAEVGWHEMLITVTPAYALDANLVLSWSGEGRGRSTLFAQADVFDDGTVDLHAGSGVSSVTIPLSSGWAAPIEVRTRTFVRAQGGRRTGSAPVVASSRFEVAFEPAASADGIGARSCWSTNQLILQPQLDGTMRGWVPFAANARHPAEILILGPSLTTPLPLPGSLATCTLGVSPAIVLPVNAPLLLFTLPPIPSSIRPLRIGAQLVRSDTVQNGFESSDVRELVYR